VFRWIDRKLWRITLKALDSFKARFVVGTTLANALGCHPTKVALRLRKRGVCPAIASVREAAIMAVFKRAALPPELLEVIGGAIADPFRESFAAAVNAAGTSFRCPALLKDGEARLRNNARTVTVRVEVGEGELVMSTECDPVSSPKRLERLEIRIGPLTDHPKMRVDRSGGGAKLIASLDKFDRADRNAWGEAARWAVAYLKTMTEVFSRETSIPWCIAMRLGREKHHA
jgi:hypothetical protein